MNDEPNSQIDQQRRLRAEYEALPELEIQRLRCNEHRWDPRLQRRAAEIIASLAGAKFDIEAVQEKHQIYAGYFHAPAIRSGYKPVEKVGLQTGEYILKSREDLPLAEKVKSLEYSNSVLRQMDGVYHENFERLTAEKLELEAQVKKLEKQLAKEKKKMPTGKK